MTAPTSKLRHMPTTLPRFGDLDTTDVTTAQADLGKRVAFVQCQRERPGRVWTHRRRAATKRELPVEPVAHRRRACPMKAVA